ncbi:MAG TPA: alpha/beta fold hydrolase [Bacteroidia bacterium]|jgi:esterase/lipase
MSRSSLLLLHGAIGAKAQLEPLASLLKEKYDVHAMNFSGHGGEPLPGKFSIDRFAKDVLVYLGSKGLQRVNIFGYSMGGYVALYLARHYPGKVERIFTLATKFDWTPAASEKESKMLDPVKIEEKLPGFAKTLRDRHAPQDWKEVLKKTAEMMIEMGDRPPLTPTELSGIKHTVIVSVGDRDKMVSMQETMEASSRIPNAHFHVLQDTLHPIEQTPLDRLRRELISFF